MSGACSKCGAPRNGTGRYCLDCHAAYMREYRQKHPLTGAPLERQASRDYAREYRRRGLLEQQPCVVCGGKNSEMHHIDHEQPLKVTWFCRPCHLLWHAFWRLTILLVFDKWLTAIKAGQAEAASDQEAA